MKKILFILAIIFIATANLNAQRSYKARECYYYYLSHAWEHVGGMDPDSVILGSRNYFKNSPRDTGKIKQYADLDKEYNKLRKESWELLRDYQNRYNTQKYEDIRKYEEEYHKKDDELHKKIIDCELKKHRLVGEIFDEYHTDFYNEMKSKMEKTKRKAKNKNFNDPIYSTK